MRLFRNPTSRKSIKRQSARSIASLEQLEPRLMLTIRPLTAADPALYGDTANGDSDIPTMSRSGDVITFVSQGTNLISEVPLPGQVYAYYPTSDTLTLVTENLQGTGPFIGSASNPVVSADGRYVIFFGVSDDLVSQDLGDDPNIDQLFVRDLQTSTTSLISVAPDGLTVGNGDSGGDGNVSVGGINPSLYAISGNGRFVVFWSRATNLVSPSPADSDQLYVRDLQTNTTRLVSRGADGNPAGPYVGFSTIPYHSLSVSDDGRHVSFGTQIDGLVPGDANGLPDVFIRDLVNDSIELVSVNANGTAPGNGVSSSAEMSRDGARVYFLSSATDLVAGATVTVGQTQLYVRDVVSQTTKLISHAAGNPLMGGDSFVDSLSISGDGQFVAFASYADDLVAGDMNNQGDIFLHDSAINSTMLVSRAFDGSGSDEFSFRPVLSGDGSKLVFGSNASNLVPNFTDNNTFYADYFVYDRLEDSLELLSADKDDPNAGGGSTENTTFSTVYVRLSEDGSAIAFRNQSSNLVPEDNNREADVFLRTDSGTQAISRRDSTLPRALAAGGSVRAASADGRYVLIAAGLDFQLDSDAGLYLRDMVEGTITPIPESRNVTANTTTHMSPDGRFITFDSDQVRLFDRVTGTGEVISITPSGENSTGFFFETRVSADGRYVAFAGSATDLIPGFVDGNSGFSDLFLRDRQAGTTFLVNRKQGTTLTSGNVGVGNSLAISDDGQTVVFDSRASDMAPNDLNGTNGTDIYAFNVVSGSMTLVSVDRDGIAARSEGNFTISADARYVAFVSRSNNIVSGVSGASPHIYVRDMQTGLTQLVDVNLAGTGAGDGIASSPQITPDGRFIAFNSAARNLTDGLPTSFWTNVYVRDLNLSSTRLVSVALDGVSDGDQSSRLNESGSRQISVNGRYVAFESAATNLVPNFVPGDNTLAVANLYLRDLETGETHLVSVNRDQTAGGNNGTSAADGPFIVLNDGRVFFSSLATDLVNAFDANGSPDAFFADPLATDSGTVSGTVFEDLDSDGVRDPDEPGIFNALVYDDTDGDGIHDVSEVSVRTNIYGTYSLVGLAVGAHRIRQKIDPNTQVTIPVATFYDIELAEAGQVIAARDFGNQILRSNLVVGNVVVENATSIRQTIHVSWTVTNQGQFSTNAATWQDAIYLSKTPTLGPDAILLSSVTHSGALGIGASYVGSAVVGANIVDDPLVPYFVIIQTDRFHVISETSEADNTAATGALTLQIPTLELGVTSNDIFTSLGTPHYFELLTVRGETLRLNLDALQGVTELYVRRGAVPTPWQFDFRSNVNGPDQEIVLPILDDEDYYIMVRAVVPPDVGQGAFTLRSQVADFQLDSLDLTSADRGGSITIGLQGADFTPDMIAELRDSTGVILSPAQQVLYVNPVLVYATFDLTQIPEGIYDVRLTRTRKEVYWAVLAGDNTNPVQVAEVPQISTLSAAFQVTEAEPDVGQIDIVAPFAIRPGRSFEIEIYYTNKGTHDLLVPLLEVSIDQDIVLESATGTGAYQDQAINVLPVSNRAPYTILRPGEVATAVLRAHMNSFRGEVNISARPTRDNGQPVDFAEFITALGDDPLTGRGAVRLQRLQDQYGTTYTSMVAGLRSWAERAAETEVPLTTSIDLFLDTAFREAPLPPPDTPVATLFGPEIPGSMGPEPQQVPDSTALTGPNEAGETGAAPLPPPPSAPPGPGTANYDPNSPFNISGGGPNLPLTEEQLISREQVMESVATGFFALGAPTGAVHLFRFLGALGPSGGGGILAYGPDSLVANEIRGHYAADFSYDTLNGLVQEYIKDRVRKRADSLPEGTTEVTEEFQGMQLNFYVGGRLPIGVPVAFDLSVAFGRVAGTSKIPLKITKKKDDCGGDIITYEGTLTYHFKDEYGFHSDGGSDLNRIINGYAENLQQAGYAGIFNTEIFMEEEVDGEMRLPPKGPPPDHCEPPTPPKPDTDPGADHTLLSLAPMDPNEIVGPGGFGPDHYRQSDDPPYPYIIRFENDPELATAPAQEVIVTHQLDSDLDWATFELGTVGFGDLNVNVPTGLQAYQTRVDYQNQDGSPLLVDISIDLNRQTGIVTWALRSVDPVTGTLPDGVFDGLLPVNDETGRGEGFMQYSIRPKSGLVSGTSFDQQAAIVFDLNEPIFTNVYRNILDDLSPASQVAGLPATTDSTRFQVSWSGTDGVEGSGIGSYDVFVSVNEGPYTLWLDDTVQTSALYAGQNGHAYRFYSVATDNVDLVEHPPLIADATILVSEAPQLTVGGPEVTWTKKDPPVTVVPEIVVGGTASLGGGVLTITMDAKGSKKKAKDRLSTASFEPLGASAGLEYGTGRLTLRIQLKSNVTQSSVQNFLRSIKFSTSGPGLRALTRRLDITLADAGGLSTSVFQAINVRKKAPR